VVVYKNTPDVLVKTWRNEGIRGVQKGLVLSVRSIFIVVRLHLTHQENSWPLSLTELYLEYLIK
jgi:hypothetical protein